MKAGKNFEKAGIIKGKLKSLIVPFVFLGIMGIGVLAATHLKDEEAAETEAVINKNEMSQQDIVLENDQLKFVMDSDTTQFALTVKSTGTVWYSNPQDADSDSIAMPEEIENLKSTLLLTSSTINGVDTLYDNYKYSMVNGTYAVEASEDSVKVKYSIGETEKEYVVPIVIEADRMEELFAAMSKSDASTVKQRYKKYDINDLGKKDNKEELLEKYPVLSEKPIYVLRDGVKDNLKKKFEEMFTEVGYTKEEYEEEKALYSEESSSDKPVFDVSVVYRLDGGDLVVEVPMQEITYKKDYPILSLNVLPYFGAGSSSDDGYMLVPEGGGGIIRFNNGKVTQNSYVSNTYGWDMAEGRDYLVHETRNGYGAFGEAKNGQSYLCILEEGAPYCSISADISGHSNSYNFVNASYSILHREQCDVADKYNGEMFVYEQNIPQETLARRYRFVDSDSYVDMANCYHDYLAEKLGDSFSLQAEQTTTPVAVEILGAADKIRQFMGVPVSEPLKLTSYEQAQTILGDLEQSGMSGMQVKLSGWTNGGIRQQALMKVKPVSSLGSKKELKSLISFAQDHQMKIYLDGVTNYAYDNTLSDGFWTFRDSAVFANKEKAELMPFSTVYYGELKDADSYYLMRPKAISSAAQNLAAAASSYGADGVSFRDIGYQLSADYSQKCTVTRQAAEEMQTNDLAAIRSGGLQIMTNAGNDYTLGYTNMITNMDLEGSDDSIIDEKVPFYQIALHGFVNYTGEALNLTADCQDELLRSAEYGAGLSFTFMDADAEVLQNTEYTQYFGANYSAWKDKAIAIYTRYEEALGSTFAERITGHEQLAPDVMMTTYEDGTKVYVNYGCSDYALEDGTKVGARDYLAVRG